jgi:hypothetical protein
LLVGKVTCHTLMGGTIFNEGEAGFGKIEGFRTFGCVKEPTACPGTFLTAELPILENPLEVQRGTEKELIARRGESTLPWESEMYETETEKQKFLKDKIENIFLTLVLPCEPLKGEYRFTGTLEPLVVNGAGSGLAPTHMTFQGKGGQTGHLNAISFPTLQESEKVTPVSGELTMMGSKEELIQAE